ncbi:MAG: 3-dehydroquinate synthase family protein [Sphaerochaetaceae bacterium]|nr:3-dehydroquinate synthase [Spirochaetales bacterium]MDY5500138.1 3-dehydroquinate synthase family protein [Sphaerochaetaceae bacterium]
MDELWKTTLAGGKTTTVLIASGLQDLSRHLGEYGRNVMWVFDTHTAKFFKQLPPNNIVLESGETNKNINSLLRIMGSAADYGMARDSRFIGFGGGVVCDMAALAASLYMRGCRLTLVPTTLLCMCDATLGGKTAIDFQGNKNLIGSFYPADEVLVCTDTLRTLPDKEYHNGMGEILKHALLSPDTELYKFLLAHRSEILKREPQIVEKMLELSLAVKRFYLEQDPTETKGIRQMLNLGHTFGHALESISHFGTFSHGECVAWGTCKALEAGIETGVCDKSFAESGIKLFKLYGYDTDYRIGRGEWLEYREHIAHDKKKVDGKVRFVIPEHQGSCLLMPLAETMIQHLVIQQYS